MGKNLVIIVCGRGIHSRRSKTQRPSLKVTICKKQVFSYAFMSDSLLYCDLIKDANKLVARTREVRPRWIDVQLNTQL